MTTTEPAPDAKKVANQVFANYVDGHSARLHRVSLNLDIPGRALILTPAQGDPIVWSLPDIRELPDQASKVTFVCTLKDEPAARLVITDGSVAAELRRRCFNRNQTKTTFDGPLIAKWAVGAVASVLLIILVLIPSMANQLAKLLPPEGERALGDATFEQIRSALGHGNFQVRTCDNKAGLTALTKMEATLSADLELPYPVSLRVLHNSLVNAFALPGGYVVMFDGLISAAATPEEVAAVLAHEIGHVAARDPTRIALRSAGSIGVLGLLFGDFAGGFVVLGVANTMIEASYSQAAETAADSFAHERLKSAGVRPDALAEMFQTMRKLGGDAQGIQAYFSSHPATDARITAAREASAGMTASSEPILTASEWADLQNICKR